MDEGGVHDCRPGSENVDYQANDHQDKTPMRQSMVCGSESWA